MAMIFKNKVIALEERIQRLPNGRSAKITAVKHPRVAVIIPVIGGRFLLENHYRPVIRKWLLEFPAGFVEKGESPIHAARRELEEETGLKAKGLKYLFKNYSSAGFTDELAYFFLAEAFSKGRRSSEEGEIQTLRKISIEKALQMVKEGRIADSKTQKGILYYTSFLYKK
ncbi:MAG: NUDIX hydrolase [Candidatus Micrarchaeales archaeon]|nr:NUDIX hydrolase [Candidatus Micrarchaeales archaeon]